MGIENNFLAKMMISQAYQFESAEVFRRRSRSMATFFVVLTLYLASLIDLPRKLDLGGVTGLAVITVFFAFMVWLLWLARPVVSRVLVKNTLPFMLLLLWGATSLVWVTPSLSSAQNFVVIFGFVGFIIICGREVRRTSEFYSMFEKTFSGATVILIILYIVSFIKYGMGSKDLISSPGVGLFCLLSLSGFAARWMYGSRFSLLWCIAILGVLVLTLARMPLAVGLGIMLLASILRKQKWQFAKSIILVSVAVGSMYFLLMNFEPLHDKYFRGDNALEVGDVAINASGRVTMWRAVFKSIQEAPYLGKGIGSSKYALARIRSNHPHNDYLRLWHDLGALGLLLWFWGYFGSMWSIWKRWRLTSYFPEARSEGQRHMAAFLAMLAIGMSMMTDNTIVYSYIMMPLGIMIGIAMGTDLRIFGSNQKDWKRLLYG
ncbi:O-antigen ligase family protein [Rhodocaloribacter sp.]